MRQLAVQGSEEMQLGTAPRNLAQTIGVAKSPISRTWTWCKDLP
jgi:hypothetical protein